MPPAPPAPDDARHLGLLAFGDSITNGGGELQWGVALQSWALWTARALGLPYTSYAADGATAADVVAKQIPAFERTATHPEASFELGALYIGVNEVRSEDWDPKAYERDVRAALAWLRKRSERLLTLTAPLDLGRPRAGAKVVQLNAIIRDLADEHGALVCDLGDFGARNLVMADHVHPTAFGQVAIAERALAVLFAAGMRVRVPPRELISFQTTWLGRLRGDATYAYRAAKAATRAVWAR